MPLIRELDPSAGPLEFFGAELRRRRNAAGLSLEQLGQRIGFTGSQVGKVETGDRVPTRLFAEACDRVFPDLRRLFARLYDLAHRADGHPAWFIPWLDAERRATSLFSWEPLVVPGLLQTNAYARAMFAAWRPPGGDEELAEQVASRLERQAILDAESAPMLWVIIDEMVLHRQIGAAETMRDQLLHLADLADRPKITVQVIPAAVGAHVGLDGAFMIAAVAGESGIVYMETPDGGQTTTRPATISKLSEVFDKLRAEALPRGGSVDLIVEVAGERWT